MANQLIDNVITGTLGELLVQLRLLGFGIQAAPPLKDSGNDLIGIKGEVVKFIQVKTSEGRSPRNVDPKRIYHIMALVELKRDGGNKLLLDQSRIFVYKKGETNKRELTQEIVDELWGSNE